LFYYFFFYPLSAAGEERVVEQSDDRVSQPGGHDRHTLAPMSAGLTHPDYAALVDPLFRFAGKRVAAFFVLLFNIFVFNYLYYIIIPTTKSISFIPIKGTKMPPRP